MNEPKTPMQKFLAGKGFYIALALCVAGTGTAAWLAVDRTIDEIDDNNRSILESQPEDFSQPETVDTPQDGVSVSSGEEQPQDPASSSGGAAAEPSGSSVSSVPQSFSFALPVAGETLNPYSAGKLVKDETLGEWRTHDGLDLAAIGPAFERHENFPERINAEFVQKLDDTRIRMRVWERGSGETWACGTGACASVAALTEQGLVPAGQDIQVELRGGVLAIRVLPGRRLLMTGPAVTVCEGIAKL